MLFDELSVDRLVGVANGHERRSLSSFLFDFIGMELLGQPDVCSFDFLEGSRGSNPKDGVLLSESEHREVNNAWGRGLT